MEIQMRSKAVVVVEKNDDGTLTFFPQYFETFNGQIVVRPLLRDKNEERHGLDTYRIAVMVAERWNEGSPQYMRRAKWCNDTGEWDCIEEFDEGGRGGGDNEDFHADG